MRISSILLAVVFSFHLVGADQPSVTPRILDGTIVSAASFPTVVKIKHNGSFSGTGTMISPIHILTAAHVLYDQLGTLVLNTNSRVEFNGVDYQIGYYSVHPTYNPRAFTFSGENIFDVSILELSSAPNITPTPINRYPLTVGTQMKIAGFGLLGNGLFGVNGLNPAQGTISYGFTPIDYLTPTYIVWQYSSGESGKAPGDSGGPSFILQNGADHVAGVTHGGPPSPFWNAVQNDTRVDIIAPWIDSVIGFTNLRASSSATHANVAFRGQSFQVSTHISNDSFNDAGSFPVRYKLSVDRGYSLSDPTVIYSVHSGLNKRSTISALAMAPIPQSVPCGAYYLTYRINEDDSQYESDYSDNFYFSSKRVVVLDEPAVTFKKKFAVNFKRSFQDTIDFTFVLPSNLLYSSKLEFWQNTGGKQVSVYAGAALLDTGTFYVGKSKPLNGKLTWDYRKGTLRYTTTRRDLRGTLVPYGALNTNVYGYINVPLWFSFNGRFYGEDSGFFYVGSQGKTGKAF